MSCTNQYDICLIRGDTYELNVGLTAAYVEVADTPSEWRGRMVFRDYQSDDATEYLVLYATPEVNPDPLPDEVPIYLNFYATPTQTQALPPYDHVQFVELEYIGPAISGAAPITRLFEGKVGVSD